MTDITGRKLPRLRWYLLGWFAVAASILVFVYSALLDRYLLWGIDLRTEALLEQVAVDYELAVTEEPSTPLPLEANITSYLEVSDIPAPFHSVFSLDSPNHGESLIHLNIDIDDDTPEDIINTLDLCGLEQCELVFLYTYQLKNGTWLYLLHGLVGSEEIYSEFELNETIAFALGGAFVLVFSVLALIGSRSIDTPLRRLEAWSLTLSADNPNLDVGNLRFQELDTLASRLRYAFERMRDGIEGEKMFLRHASHELRTPLAILSSNVELLEKLTDRTDRPEAEKAAFVRQYRALEDVRLLIETLLWINRQSETLPKPEQIHIRQELENIVSQHEYLIKERSVSLSIEGEDHVIEAPAAAVRIILSNLIRNAFQYTFDGEVVVRIEQNIVSVQNQSSPGSGSRDGESDDYGFGFGLELVSRICRHLDWKLTSTEQANGRDTRISF